MCYVATPMVAPYVTLGEEDTVTFEAEAAAQGFEDINSTATLRLLQKTMRKEETRAARRQRLPRARHARRRRRSPPRAPAPRLPAATYSVIVVALTFEGYRNSSASAAASRRRRRSPATTATPIRSTAAPRTEAPTRRRRSRSARRCRRPSPIVNGAVAYAWFVGAAGSETLQAITTINSATFAAPLLDRPAGARASSPPTIRAIATLAFDGLLTVGFNPANTAYVQSLAIGNGGHGHVPHRLGPRLGGRDRQHAGARCGTTIGCRRR